MSTLACAVDNNGILPTANSMRELVPIIDDYKSVLVGYHKGETVAACPFNWRIDAENTGYVWNKKYSGLSIEELLQKGDKADLFVCNSRHSHYHDDFNFDYSLSDLEEKSNDYLRSVRELNAAIRRNKKIVDKQKGTWFGLSTMAKTR